MRKILTMALLLIGLSVSAQGLWSVGTNKADELTGTKAGSYYRYTVEGMGSIIIWDWSDWVFRLVSYNGGFNTWEIKGHYRTVYYTTMLIGIYDSSGALVEKFKDDIEVDYNQYGKYATINRDWPYSPGKRRKLKKAIRAMKNEGGFVRIVCERRGKPDFDLTITPFDSQKAFIDDNKY